MSCFKTRARLAVCTIASLAVAAISTPVDAALMTVAAFDQNQTTDGSTISANQATGGVGGGAFASLDDGGNSATDSAVSWSSTDNGITATVTHNRSDRDRDRGVGGPLAAHTLADLYRDFTHFDSQFASGNMTVKLEGLAANTPYQLTWFTYDNSANASGASFPWHVYQDSVAAGNLLFSKTTDYNNSTDPDVTGPNVFTVTSDSNSEILLIVGRSGTVGSDTGARSIAHFNGLLVEGPEPAPEPSTAVLAAFGLLGMVGWRRRLRRARA